MNLEVLRFKPQLEHQRLNLSPCYVRLVETNDRMEQDLINIDAHKRAIKDYEDKIQEVQKPESVSEEDILKLTRGLLKEETNG